MINLRFHIVSLVAVFLALGVGIVMGSTFITQGELATIRRNLHRVESRDRDVERENADLRRQRDQLADFGHRLADQSRDGAVRGQLRGIPVTIVAVRGVDRAVVDGMRQQLVLAGADFRGTLWCTSKLKLSSAGDLAALGTALGSPAGAPQGNPDGLRQLALTRLAAGLGGTADLTGPAALRAAGFLDYEAPPAPPATTTSEQGASGTEQPQLGGLAPVAHSHVLEISGAGAEVGDDQVGAPLAEALAAQPTGVVAAEAGQDTPGGREVFVGVLRRAHPSPGLLSTVDNLDSSAGQLATVLALADLERGRVGNYGVAPGRNLRLLPAPPP